MTTNKQIQLLEKLTNKKVILENDFFKQHILSKEEKLERRLNSIRRILYKGGTYKGGLNLSEIKGFDSLYNLERVEGSLDLDNTQIKDLGKLKHVGSYLFLNNTQIESLGKLEHVGGYLSLHKTPIESLGKLEYAGGALSLYYCKNLKDLGSLERVGGVLDLQNTQIESLGNLKYIGGDLLLSNSLIKDLGNLEYVGGKIYINSNTPLYHNKELIEEYKGKGFKFRVI